MSPQFYPQPLGTFVGERMDEFAGFKIFGFGDNTSPQYGEFAPGWSVAPISWFTGEANTYYFSFTYAQGVTYTESAGDGFETGVDFSMVAPHLIGWSWRPEVIVSSYFGIDLISYNPAPPQTSVFNVVVTDYRWGAHTPPQMSLTWEYKITPPNQYSPSPNFTDSSVITHTITENDFDYVQSGSGTPTTYGPFTFTNNPNGGYYYAVLTDAAFDREIQEYFNNA